MTHAEKPRRPRFPYVAALLCAACLCAAVWTWMRYSYVWDVEPKDVCWSREAELNWPSRYVGKYVRLRGVFADKLPPSAFVAVAGSEADYLVRGPSNKAFEVLVRSGGAEVPAPGTSVVVCGRAIPPFVGFGIIVDSTSSRLHGASIAGLVVGAMGVFVFTVALRHWLRERRAIMELEASSMRIQSNRTRPTGLIDVRGQLHRNP